MESRILFIDGFCVLCNGLAKYVLKHDRKGKLKIASLQGETASSILSLAHIQDLNTVVYYRDKQILDKSSAVLRLMVDIGGWRKILIVFFAFPKGFRDWAYTGVANKRYKWFGKNETCQLPDDNSKNQILE